MYKFIDLSIHLVRYRSQSLHGTWIFFGGGVVYVVEFKSLVRDIAQNVSAISSLGPDLLIFNLLLQYTCIGIRIIIPLQASSKIYSYIWNIILRVNGCFVHLYSRLMPLRRHPSRASRIPDTENEADFLLSPISPINHEGYVFYIDSCLAVIYMA